MNKNVIFFFYKIGEKGLEQVLSEELVSVGGGRMWGKRVVQILGTHECHWKVRLVETIPGMGEGG
jgi:hypothetical protein